jgi:hypothetical protein
MSGNASPRGSKLEAAPDRAEAVYEPLTERPADFDLRRIEHPCDAVRARPKADCASALKMVGTRRRNDRRHPLPLHRQFEVFGGFRAR